MQYLHSKGSIGFWEDVRSSTTIFLLFIQNFDLLSAPAPIMLLFIEVTKYSTLPNLMICPVPK
jgi:hypothetical protein